MLFKQILKNIKICKKIFLGNLAMFVKQILNEYEKLIKKIIRKFDHACLSNDGVRWISSKLNTTANQTPTDRNGFNTNQTKLGKVKEI